VNTTISPNWVSMDTAAFFKNSTRLFGSFDPHWEGMWRDLPDGAKIGYTAQVRLPQRWQVFEGQALQQQAILNQTVTVSINHQLQVAHGWSSADDKLVIEEAQERYDEPAGISMATAWDKISGLEVYRSVYMQIGAPGVPLSSDQVWLDGVAKLGNVAVPDDDLRAVIDLKTHSKLLGANIGSFNPQPTISKYYRTGQFNEGALGVEEWLKDSVGVPTHTTGTFTTSTPLVDGALQTGSTLVTKGWGTYAFNAGDTFYLAGVDATNPIGYTDTSDPQAFSLQVAVAGSGAATFTISPAIIPTNVTPMSPLATVTSSPANNATILFVGSTGTVNATMAAQTSKQSLLFNPDAFARVLADLPVNLAGARAGRTSRAAGMEDKISMRYVDQYNIQTDQLPRRLDSIGCVAVILPYFALRAWS
jgi:hypothetical protein